MNTPAWGRKLFSEEAEKKIESAIQDLESEVGAELKIAILNESDPYPAASWRFCVLSFFILFLIVYEIYYSAFKQDWQIVGVALLSFLVSYALSRLRGFKQLFLTPKEVIREVREKALELFFSLQIHETSHRSGSFLMISLLERRIEFLVDKNLKPHLTEDELANLMMALRSRFKHGDFENGILDCITLIKEKFKKELPELKGQTKEIHNSIVWVNP